MYIINDAIDNRTLFMVVLLRDPHPNKKDIFQERKISSVLMSKVRDVSKFCFKWLRTSSVNATVKILNAKESVNSSVNAT